MSLTTDFYEKVEVLKAPRAGTELMGPLLYSLVRTARPRALLEVGMGYTSPFLLKAIVDNKQDVDSERLALKNKNLKYLNAIANEDIKNLKPGSLPLSLLHEWIAESPALVSPAYYQLGYEPVFHAIDNFSSNSSHSSRVSSVLKTLDLTEFLHMHEGDFREHYQSVISKTPSLDFVWYDCGNAEDYKDFIELFWERINPDGGMLLLHSTLNRYSYNAVLNYFKNMRSKTQDIEVLSLLEPHKLTQGSVSLIKKVKAEVPKFPVENAYDIIDSIKNIL